MSIFYFFIIQNNGYISNTLIFLLSFKFMKNNFNLKPQEYTDVSI